MLRNLICILAVFLAFSLRPVDAQDCPMPLQGNYTWSGVTPSPTGTATLSATNIQVGATCTPGQNNVGVKKINVNAYVNGVAAASTQTVTSNSTPPAGSQVLSGSVTVASAKNGDTIKLVFVADLVDGNTEETSTSLTTSGP